MLKSFKFLLFLLSLVSITSCSIQKRHYMPGYSIAANNFSPKSSFNKINPVIFPSIEVKTIKDTCDVMELKDSSIVRVKIIEIRQTDITYKICGNLGDSVLKVNKSEVAGIDFTNGLKGEFDSAGKLKPKKDKVYEKPKEGEKIVKDSNHYNAIKIVAIPKGGFKQNGLALHTVEFWRLLAERNKPEIDKLLYQSKDVAKKQAFGFLIIPLAVALFISPLALWFVVLKVVIVIDIIFILAIICLAINSRKLKKQRRKIDLEAASRYNDSLLQ